MPKGLLTSGLASIALALLVTAGRADAQEYVTADGKLSDDDFYRLVACAAPPSGACQKDFVRWSAEDAKDISVRLVRVDDGFPARVRAKVDGTLDQTIAELNATGANLHLSHAPADAIPDIRIFLLDLPRDSAVAGTGLPWFDGIVMQAARFQMGWRDDGSVIECAIAISRDVVVNQVRRILIEEVTQCLGLMTDIGGTYYASQSIFSEDGSRAMRLGPQDLKALRRHYP